VTYLITFSCYGCHLHGEDDGSVDRDHNLKGNPLAEVDPERIEAERKRMDQAPYQMDPVRRDAVLSAIQGVCAYRSWTLYAAHVRTNHVHVVVGADETPEKVMNDFKTYASRKLNELGLDRPGRKRWTRHGSTRYLAKHESVSAAIRYVVDEQGEGMAVLEAQDV
jgi:REP element-mobilizing transposase RayT